ncbi:MAG: PfkB family carbohydrate kinase [Nanoarchaeota archaeon]|nr:PfkB family carbohydrate kinase [Nanoarchaeota archaeon]
MEKRRLIEVVDSFKDKNIVVFGDVAIDKYVYGKVERVNPENPGAPLLKIEKKEYRLGCAANVALNILSLQGKACLGCVIGDDNNGKLFEDLCNSYGIKLFSVREGEMIIKERSIESEFNQYLLRTDDGEFSLPLITTESQNILLDNLARYKIDAIILSDYNKHLFRNGFAKRIISFGEKNKIPVVVDPKPVNSLSFENSTLICPNLKEAKEIVDSNSEEPRYLARKLKEIVKSKYIIVTCGKNGMVCYDGNEFTEIPTKVREVVDVTGAGDTVCAVVTLGLASGLNLVESAHLANYAAGIVVEKQGTSSVNAQELISRINED